MDKNTNESKMDSEQAKQEFLDSLPPDPEPKYILETFASVEEDKSKKDDTK